MTVFFDATEEDAIATVWYMQTQRKGQKTLFRNLRLVGWVLAAFSALLAVLMIANPSTSTLVFVSLYGFMALLFIRQEQMQRKAVAQAVQGGAAQTVMGSQEYTLTPHGIRHKSRYSDGILPWDGIAKIEVTETHLAFHFSEMQAFLIPKSAFPSEAQCLQFLQQAQQYRLQEATQPVTPQTSGGTWWTQSPGTIDDERQRNTQRQ